MQFHSLADLMALSRPGDLPVAILGREVLDFARFRKDVIATLEGLKEVGGREAALATRSSYLYCVGFFASLHAGRRLRILSNSLPGTLEQFTGSDCPLLTDQPVPGGVLSVPIGGTPSADFEFQPLVSDDCDLDFYTSGSTGEPKRVPKKLWQIDNELAVLQAIWGERLKGAAALGTVTHQHIFGLYFKTLLPLCAGRPIFPETFEIWEELLAVAPEGACFVSSPAHLSRIPPFDPLTGPVQPVMIFSAGGPLSREAAEEAARIFGPLPTEIYGSTETGGIASRQQTGPDIPFRPLPGMETRLEEDGLLAVRSDYTDNKDWFATNDFAERFEDGSFLLSGRASQFVKIEGKRFSLAEVEKYLTRSDLVREVAALILKDARGSLAAVVELTEAGEAMLAEIGSFRLSRRLRQELRHDLENAAIPRRWRFVDRLPVNSQGKRLQQDLHQLFTG